MFSRFTVLSTRSTSFVPFKMPSFFNNASPSRPVSSSTTTTKRVKMFDQDDMSAESNLTLKIDPSMTLNAWNTIKEKLLETDNNQNTFSGIFASGQWKQLSNTESQFSVSMCPSTGQILGKVSKATLGDLDIAVTGAKEAFKVWAAVPMPKRGDVIRQIKDALVELKEPLATLVSLETGKILPEGLGEVQECIDVCDYALGLSRQLGGSLIPSERPDHVILERWNPLGTVGIITAFNFPVAVWAWNAAIGLVCGNTLIWKPAGSTCLSAIALTRMIEKVLRQNGLPPAICSLVAGGADVGSAMAESRDIDLLSFTGSTHVGREVALKVQGRFGRHLLELGGNNAIIVMEDADQGLALQGTLFAAIGTSGQRCTSARRLLVHRSIWKEFIEKLVNAYAKVIKIGHALDPEVNCGPVHRTDSISEYSRVIQEVIDQGGEVLFGNRVSKDNHGGFYALPTLTRIKSFSDPIIQKESFVPILHVLPPFDTIEQAIEVNNSVRQGLSSAIFTTSQENMFKFTGAFGSDCGLVNVNASTCGAEIGGAFGGEKETGGGRESGSNSWQQYMRRATCTINYGKGMPLAQGISSSAWSTE